jgi:tRNA G26 N,N-dimethylase Trm1
MSGERKPWHGGLYRKLAPLVVAQANANPQTRCPTCGQQSRPGDPWQAGHVTDGKIVTSIADLVAEHRSCNASKGARRGNTIRASGYGW